MRMLLIILATAVGVVGGGAALQKKGITLPKLGLPKTASVSSTSSQIAANFEPAISASPAGQVMGVQTTDDSSLKGKLASVGNTVGQVASTIGNQVGAIGGALVKNLTTPAASEKDVIDLSKVAQDVTTQVENLPANFLTQAKIDYCRGVLEAATASGRQN